ncbi:hypothetical protein QFC22_002807 [Naganishia vaughanmartiniae]|uniref:Uncharacterized protein n=1 Tax=Naganishia vaughanmartiniae TaxID=1424756 RepID=A0ACC2XDR0_9TREE|nr:hypothetical protein QFC22_002807 [Naganishia vaughanmartiniae]
MVVWFTDEFGTSVTLIPEPTPSGPTAEEIAKVIKEHEEKEARRRKASAEKGGKAGSDAVKGKEKDDVSKPSTPGKDSSPATGESTATLSKATTGGHRRYALHRGIFTMRQRELRAREQGVQAKEKSKGSFSRVTFSFRFLSVTCA